MEYYEHPKTLMSDIDVEQRHILNMYFGFYSEAEQQRYEDYTCRCQDLKTEPLLTNPFI